MLLVNVLNKSAPVDPEISLWVTSKRNKISVLKRHLRIAVLLTIAKV